MGKRLPWPTRNFLGTSTIRTGFASHSKAPYLLACPGYHPQGSHMYSPILDKSNRFCLSLPRYLWQFTLWFQDLAMEQNSSCISCLTLFNHYYCCLFSPMINMINHYWRWLTRNMSSKPPVGQMILDALGYFTTTNNDSPHQLARAPSSLPCIALLLCAAGFPGASALFSAWQWRVAAEKCRKTLS